MPHDHRRLFSLIVGGAPWNGERVAAVQETFLAAVKRYGRPDKAMSDGGSAFYSWSGVGRTQRTACAAGVVRIAPGFPVPLAARRTPTK